MPFKRKLQRYNAGICRLCSQDAIGVKNALERYEVGLCTLESS